MSRKPKQSDDGKADRLRALRLAHEAARREAGTWGDVTVGEILHQASRSVLMQVWRGQHRPDPFADDKPRRAGASAVEWSAIMAWVNERNSPDFRQRIIAWDLSAAEARRVLEARAAEHEAAGYAVTKPSDATKKPSDATKTKATVARVAEPT